MTTDPTTIEPTPAQSPADPPSAASPTSPPTRRTTDPTVLFRLLGDPLRLRLLDAVTPGNRSVTELCKLLTTAQPSVSHALSLLALGGLVESNREGKSVFYRLTTKGRRVLAFVERETGVGASQIPTAKARGLAGSLSRSSNSGFNQPLQ